MKRSLSRICHNYVLAVGIAGMVPLGWAVWDFIAHPPTLTWYLLAALALLSGPLSIRLPSLKATISVSEGFIFAAALLFGPAAATVIAVIDGLAVSLWSNKPSTIRILFSIGEPAISVCAASLLFYQVAGVPPLLYQLTPFASLILPLLVLTLAYFALNTVLAGAAVWLENGADPRLLLRQHVPHMALHFSVSLSLAAALVQTNGNITLAAIVVLLPMLLASYISSQQVAGRLEDTNRHLAELRRLYDSTVETLAMAIDAKDQITHGHIRRVQLLSTRVARAMGSDDREIQALEAAALLHDLGKLAVPEHILNKPGPLTAAEYDEMKKHADVGASILSAIDFPFPVVPIVRHHHESWDGSGYPDGLRGTEIPLGARILAVVDCYDALTSDRPYRRRMTHDEALDIIRSRSGRIYDPAVVDAFVGIEPLLEAETEPLQSNVVSLSRSVARPLQPRTPGITGAVPMRPRREGRERVQRFLSTLEGATWQEAGQAVAEFVPGLLPDSVAALYQVDPTRHQLTVAGMHRAFDARVPDTMALGHGVSGWVAANRQTMVNTDAELDLGEIAGIVQPPLRLCISAPLVCGSAVEGVLTVYSPYAFSEPDRMLIEALADGLPAALRSATESVQATARAAGM